MEYSYSARVPDTLLLECSDIHIGGVGGRPSMLSSDGPSAPAWLAKCIDGPLHCIGGCCGGPACTGDLTAIATRMVSVGLIIVAGVRACCDGRTHVTRHVLRSVPRG